MCETGKNNIIIRHDLFILPGSEWTKAKTAAECQAPWRRLETHVPHTKVICIADLSYAIFYICIVHFTLYILIYYINQ